MKLLFIISQPRSGSTLLQSLVSNNPYIATSSEPWLLLPFLSMYKPSLMAASFNYQWMLSGLNDFVKKGIGAKEFKERLKEFLMSIYSSIETSETRYVLDKTPRYYQIASVIREVFPDAKIIVLKRSPFAVVSSMIKSWQINSLDKLCNYSVDILSGPFLIDTFAREHAHDKNVLQVHYETLVKNPRLNTKMIYDWLDIPFDDGVLDYSSNSKFKGSLGDQIGINKHSRPVSDSYDSWETLLEHTFWGNFLRGYSAYLGSEFLNGYGEYEAISSKSSQEFKYYQFLNAMKKRREFQPAREFKYLLNYIYYRATLGESKYERFVEY